MLSSLISSLYICCASARAYSHDPQPPPIIPFGEPTPQPGGKLPSHDILLWDVFFWYCPRYFSAFEYYFPLIKHVFYLASSWTNPGQIAPSRYSPVCPTRQNLQTFSVSDVSDSDIWTNGRIQHRPTRLLCALELWKIGKSKSLTIKLTVLLLLSEAIASKKNLYFL